MRRLLLALAGLAVAAASPALAAAGFMVDPAQLLADAPTSGAETMVPGETYVGPGPMTVGYLGAKKQIVLPEGAWLLLAVGDRDSTHRAPMRVVSMVFGRFADGGLAGLMRYQFNARPGPAANHWSEYSQCQRVAATIPDRRVERSEGQVDLCAYVGRYAHLPATTDPTWQRAADVLAALGAPLPGGPVVQTLATVVDNRANLLFAQRVDFGDGRSAARMPWLERYADLLFAGFAKRVDADELQPVKPPQGRTLSLPE